MPIGIKGFQKGNTVSARQYCLLAHDTYIVGRDKSGNCKECRRAHARKAYLKHPNTARNCRYRRQFGITLDVYNQMLERQGNSCYGCLRKDTEFDKRLSVDHCHKTGRVRALLCADCNTVLGRARDNTAVLKRLAYLLEDYR